MGARAIEPVQFSLAERDFADFAAALGASFARHGFAVVAGHPVSDAIALSMLARAKALFALPAEVKARYHVPGGAGQRGYTPFAVETAKGEAHPDLKEFWHVGRPGEPSGGSLPDNVWPSEVPQFETFASILFGAMEYVALILMAAIEVYLGVAEGVLVSAAEGGSSVLRLLHYPPSDFTGAAVRAAPHEDINAITLLLGAEEAGLQILERHGGWLPIDPPPGALVVNIGDMLARLTNDVLPSTTHRVVNPGAKRAGVARYSMPFFLHLRSGFLIETLPECVREGRPNRYPAPITAEAFLARRLKEIGLA
ncbi:MAG TPA: 2OG-Fe(II) oxygenase family protein [Caulobacteraceae bacterium]|jgi:isopenicillin N synthase-like dioxygenase|nr:2OG-Fe(II) oxygenase family protein [Caulobacteraceae bacterium]